MAQASPAAYGGMAAGRPVADLLGGPVYDKLRAYTYLYPKNAAGDYDYNDPDLAAARHY